MTTFEAILIAIVEGVTEFLPISSTGHMVLVQTFLGIGSSTYTKTYIVSIQLGAILSVVWLYRDRFFRSLDFYYKLAVGTVPALVLGFLLDDFIDSWLERPAVVAMALLLGGIVLLFIERWLRPRLDQEVTYRQAFFIGCFQCLALVPGVSRSAASIIGGMAQGLTRHRSAEFSFFLAVPTMFAATGYKLFSGLRKDPDLFLGQGVTHLILGNIVAFVVAALAIRFLITYLQRHDLKLFGWYRIVLGGLVLGLLWAGFDLSMS
ncbi:MAG: undecaprenyl-diphosphate phosphatase [Flavobacteriales bacterium]|nr:undecaprenyl-diphosphate phosphatase [Flavobacteriales bacterium]